MAEIKWRAEAHKGEVIVIFSEKVDFLTLTPEQAREFAQGLQNMICLIAAEPKAH